ncbi:PAS domain-containing protein [Minwuia thermotolerans]|uniref:PAS domain-containing protein n=1 Tax=Minwuia thermotolerans TaxID=2056226 RepID=A0A2M9G105_9PROT|nr:PAS domain-containing protein [Minwuia thermotolerans]PJK29398.1 hypothetical protein CVT23_12420 [Minwuia thermotolerans]
MTPAPDRHFPNWFRMELAPVDDIRSDALRAGLAAWRNARGEREMPARRDLDPTAMPGFLLRHLLLIDVEHAPRLRLRWRLIGTHVTEMMGRDSTGRYWDELYPPEIADILATGPAAAMRTRGPVRTLGVAPAGDRSYLRSENLDMPLSSDGETVDMIMVVSDFGRR